jgi:phosphoserine aminotransferase
MISFYPGPSRVYDEIPLYVREAHKKGILSLNHRSEEFVAISKRTVKLLKEKLDIPGTYSIFFTSSATECWEMIAQSLVQKESIHIYNGEFGEKWFDYTRRLIPQSRGVSFDCEKELDSDSSVFSTGELICLTQNETSNGTQISNKTIRQVKKTNPNHLIAVDATSSMAGIWLDFKAADVWFASVQKCFGLPAGLALLICSPRAIERITSIGEATHYNSLTFVKQMMDKWQTSCTPNVMGIYMLMKVMSHVEHIGEIEKRSIKRYQKWMEYLGGANKLVPFIKNPKVQSFTVVPVTGQQEWLVKVKSEAKKRGFLLGEGYGRLKGSSFRIANFPAIKEKEIRSLQRFLSPYL